MNELLAGAVSGLITCVGLQPLDVVKTRLQESTKNSTWRVISDLYVKKGPFGFWRGTGKIALFHCFSSSNILRTIATKNCSWKHFIFQYDTSMQVSTAGGLNSMAKMVDLSCKS